MTTRTGMVIRILAAGIAIILIINYGFKTSREHKAAENIIIALRLQLSRTQAKLGQTDVQIAILQRRVEELTSQLASRSKIERQLRKSMGPEQEPERTAPPKATRGLVTAILYTLQGSSVVIDNVILYEGDMIHGVKIAKIQQDTVEFAKGPHRWTQQIHQSPPPVWTQKNK